MNEPHDSHPCDKVGVQYEDRPLVFGDEKCEAGRWCQWDMQCWDDATPTQRGCTPRTQSWVMLDGVPSKYAASRCNGHVLYVSFAGPDGPWAHIECSVCKCSWQLDGDDVKFLTKCDPPKREDVNWEDCYIPEECV